MKNSKTEKAPKLIYDKTTEKLFKRSEQLENKSRMLIDLCEIQSKRAADLLKLSADLLDYQKNW